MTKESLFSLLFRRSRLPPPQILPELPKEVTELRPDVHQIYSDHQLLVSHLIANPKKAQAILQEYLDSPEFSHDSQLFGQFISACLFKFNPNPSEAIRIVKEAEPLSLDRGLQRIQTRVLRKLLKTINPTQESASLEEVGQQIARWEKPAEFFLRLRPSQTGNIKSRFVPVRTKLFTQPREENHPIEAAVFSQPPL